MSTFRTLIGFFKPLFEQPLVGHYPQQGIRNHLKLSAYIEQMFYCNILKHQDARQERKRMYYKDFWNKTSISRHNGIKSPILKKFSRFCSKSPPTALHFSGRTGFIRGLRLLKNLAAKDSFLSWLQLCCIASHPTACGIG